MKRSIISRHWVLSLMVLLALVLAACERPLQEDAVEALESEAPLQLLPDVQMDDSTTEPRPPLIVGPQVLEPYPAAEDESMLEAAEEAEPAPEEPAAAEPLIYQVQSGDTLLGIAQRYNVSVEDIVAANSLPSPDILDIGQQLIIPVDGVVSDETSAASAAEESPSGLESADQVHIVQSGDNLFRIGLLYGCAYEELAAYNNLTNPDSLEIGQEIRIPACE